MGKLPLLISFRQSGRWSFWPDPWKQHRSNSQLFYNSGNQAQIHNQQETLWRFCILENGFFWGRLSTICRPLSIVFTLQVLFPLRCSGSTDSRRSLADMLSILAIRLGNSVIFPFIASHAETPRSELRGQVFWLRLNFLLLAAICFAFSAAISDLVIKVIFDQRYHAASWMAPILISGTWFSIICSVNELTLLGLGKPNYNAMAYGSKFLWMLLALPLSITHFGAVGAIVVIAVSDVFRYFPVLFGQIQQRFAFALQDLLVTVLVFVLIVFFEWLRSSMGFGTSFDDLPSFG